MASGSAIKTCCLTIATIMKSFRSPIHVTCILVCTFPPFHLLSQQTFLFCTVISQNDAILLQMWSCILCRQYMTYQVGSCSADLEFKTEYNHAVDGEGLIDKLLELVARQLQVAQLCISDPCGRLESP